MRIEDYGFIGNTITAALVGKNGSIDWLCLPEFDDGACFAALLGDEDNGHWQISPAGDDFTVTRKYRENTAILETTFENDAGSVTLIDFMPLPEDERDRVDLVRIVRCDRGEVNMNMCLALRFDYGHIVPWVKKNETGILAVGGPDAVQIQTDVPLHGENLKTYADFKITAGESREFCMTWFPSHMATPAPMDIKLELQHVENGWREWISQIHDFSEWHEPIARSLITLKALTYKPTGAIVAAPTMSLPEEIGGERNWDYRYCWIRDSTLTLYAFLNSGVYGEAKDWRNWLIRAAGGEPQKLQIMYGLHGERRLTELTCPWLRGYEGSQPVRIGNEAHVQVQLDVYGELMDTLHVAPKFKLEASEEAWSLQKALIGFIATSWNKPDFGIWEMRGPARHFTHSKIMAWVAVDRAIKGVEDFGLDGPVEEWRKLRGIIHADIIENGFSKKRNSFVQSYDSEELDASLLLIGELGFLPADDPRFISTVEAVERELLHEGFVLRYKPQETDDGLRGSEGAFLACSFWLVDAYALIGRYDDAFKLFNRLLDLRNDIGLLAEEYDPVAKRQLGNFPQAFSHIALINSAHNLLSKRPPAKDRADGKAGTGSCGT